MAHPWKAECAYQHHGGKTGQGYFAEFEGRPSEKTVCLTAMKYHMGYSSDFHTKDGKNIHISLTPNPSHLETVAPWFRE